jgi:hypothetical protein
VRFSYTTEDTPMTTVTTRITVTLKQAAELIAACPNNRFIVRGEPGIGKSAIIKLLAEKTGYNTVYVDVPNMDLGDIAMPVIDKETKTTGYYPNGRFQFHLGKPVIAMLDEFSKGADPVKNMLHPLLEVNNPRLGDVPVPAGSLIFLTGNLGSDGVGDSIKAHTKMRITEVEVSKPDSKQWLEWAVDNGIHPVIMAWVYREPQCLASYRDGDQQSNQYIFFPNTIQGAVVTPRTLELVSNIVWARDKFDHNTLHAGMAGTAGEAAATSIASFIVHQDSLPTRKEIAENPLTARVPEDDGALAVLVYGAIEWVTTDTLPAFLTYIERADPEWQCIFNIALARNPRKQAMAFACKAFAEWVAKNEDLL